MVDAKPNEKPTIVTQWAGIPLYETVKMNLFETYWDAVKYLTTSNTYRSQEAKLSDTEVGKVGNLFKSKVMQLYFALRPKLQYQKQKPVYEDIKAIDPDRFLSNPHSLSIDAAIELLSSLGEFLEEDGVTKFEQEKFDPRHAWVGGIE